MPSNLNNELMAYKLTSYEKLIANLVRVGDCMVIGATILEPIKENQRLNKDLVRQALSFMQKRHLFLRAHHLINDETNEMFVKIPNDYEADPNKYLHMIPFDWCITSDHESNPMPMRTRRDLVTELEEFNDLIVKFDEKHLLWYFKALDFIDTDGKLKYCLAINFPFHLIDGIGMTALTAELVNIVNALASKTTCIEMTNVLPLAESLHTLCDKYKLVGPTQLSRIEELAKHEHVKFLLDEKFKPSGNERSVGSHMHLFKLNRDLVDKLVHLSRKHNVRITALLTTAAYYALNDLYAENGLEPIQNVSTYIPANMRIRYEPKMTSSIISMQVCIPSIEINSFGLYDNLWRDTRVVHEAIEQATDVQSGNIFSLSHNDNYINEFNEKCRQLAHDSSSLCKKLNQSASCDLLYSNVGKHVWNEFENRRLAQKEQPSDVFRLNEIYFGDSDSSSPTALCSIMFHTSYWNGEIMIHCCGNRSTISDRYFDRFIELYQQRFNLCAAQ